GRSAQLDAAMIHIMLPTQYSSGAGGRLAEPHKRVVGGGLRTGVGGCCGGGGFRGAGGFLGVGTGGGRKAVAYGGGPQRAWPFSFENLCDALGLDADGLREELHVTRVRA